MEKLHECPLCQATDIRPFISSKDYSVTGESFNIDQCHQCQFLFTNPRPDEKSIGRYYKSDQYISHSNKGNTIINVLYKIVRNYTLRQKLQLINSISTEKGKILDYGCGTGYFLKTCKSGGWDSYGIEPDDSARKLALENTGSNVFPDLKALNENVFSVITLWHVLEHVHCLQDIFKQLVSLLKNNGKMIIAVPNHESFDAGKYKEYWAAYDLPRHLYHFDKKTMHKFADQHGLSVATILPMKFDSFYVSLLSEKYKNKKLKLIDSLTTGYKSNNYAKKGNNYSSLIYILNRK